MFPLEKIYGPRAYRTFIKEGTTNLKQTRQDSLDIVHDEPLVATTYTELVGIVSFFSIMNKRHTLYFRGQGNNLDPIPTIFRDNWQSLSKIKHDIQHPVRKQKIYDGLNDHIRKLVLSVCWKFPMPRKATLEMFRESVWAVAQHYSLWPTPVIDITPNLRTAASFSLWNGRPEGILYIVALPASTNSITFDADQHVVLARLQSVCPPVAKRPHYQDGFLIGRFPFQSPIENEIDRQPDKVSSLKRRLVARILLKSSNAPIESRPESPFWTDDFPRMSAAALIPELKDDQLLESFMRHAPEIDEMMSDICKH